MELEGREEMVVGMELEEQQVLAVSYPSLRSFEQEENVPSVPASLQPLLKSLIAASNSLKSQVPFPIGW